MGRFRILAGIRQAFFTNSSIVRPSKSTSSSPAFSVTLRGIHPPSVESASTVKACDVPLLAVAQRTLEERGFSLTCRELYKIGYGKNKKINRILDRIPAQADYVLREYVNDIQTPCIKAVRHCGKNDDYDRAA